MTPTSHPMDSQPETAGKVGHTKGPWLTEYRRRSHGGYAQEIFDGAGELIATAAWFPVPLTETATTTNREANARLIASAPDLLEAVKKLTAAMRRYEVEVDGDAPQSHRDMMQEAEAAISRATGADHG